MIANGHPHGLQTSIHAPQKRKKQATQQLFLSSSFSVLFFSINAFSLDFFFVWWIALQAFNCARPCVGWLTTFLLA
jgi:hypothetical protein